MGGFVAGSRSLIDWLVNRARPYVFSTAEPGRHGRRGAGGPRHRAPRAAAPRRAAWLGRETLRGELAGQGWNIGRSASQIIPLVRGRAERAVRVVGPACASAGLFVPAIRPPTVPEGEACLRISLTAGHTEEMIGALLDALGRSDMKQ